MEEKPSVVSIELAYAEPSRQVLRPLSVPQGFTVADAIRLSQIEREVGAIAPDRIGVFGKHVNRERIVQPGDRIEIYRPLKVDPKESRRRRAKDKTAM